MTIKKTARNLGIGILAGLAGLVNISCGANFPGSEIPYNPIQGRARIGLHEETLRANQNDPEIGPKEYLHAFVEGFAIQKISDVIFVPNVGLHFDEEGNPILPQLPVQPLPFDYHTRVVENDTFGISSIGLSFTDNDNFSPASGVEYTGFVIGANSAGIVMPYRIDVEWNRGWDDDDPRQYPTATPGPQGPAGPAGGGGGGGGAEPCTDVPLADIITKPETYTRFTDEEFNPLLTIEADGAFRVVHFQHPDLDCYTNGAPVMTFRELGDNPCVVAEFNPADIVDESPGPDGYRVTTLTATDLGLVTDAVGTQRRAYEVRGNFRTLGGGDSTDCDSVPFPNAYDLARANAEVGFKNGTVRDYPHGVEVE